LPQVEIERRAHIFKQKVKPIGSITVEAALVMPLFIYGIMAFLYLFQIIYIQECIQSGITEVAKEASRYGFIYEDVMNSQEVDSEEEDKDTKTKKDTEKDTSKKSICKTIVDGSFLQIRLGEHLDQCNFNDDCIVGGKTGIVMFLSSFMEDEETIDVVAVYHIKIPIAIIKVNGFTMVSRVRTRAFIGLDQRDEGEDSSGNDENDEDQIVFITETGTVYHKSKECSHLKLSISSSTLSQLKLVRNQNGGIYKPCEKCADNNRNDNKTVFITKEGNRYHISLDCSGLKRTIFSVPLSQVVGKRPCKRCY
jgi:hypothetical protein